MKSNLQSKKGRKNNKSTSKRTVKYNSCRTVRVLTSFAEIIVFIPQTSIILVCESFSAR